MGVRADGVCGAKSSKCWCTILLTSPLVIDSCPPSAMLDVRFPSVCRSTSGDQSVQATVVYNGLALGKDVYDSEDFLGPWLGSMPIRSLMARVDDGRGFGG